MGNACLFLLQIALTLSVAFAVKSTLSSTAPSQDARSTTSMLWFPRLVMKVSELLRAAIASELSDAPLVTEIRHNFDKIMTYVRCVPPILRMQLISRGT